MNAPELEHVMTLHVLVADPLVIGDIGTGIRRVIPITGGTFTGRDVQGTVVPGGADWNLERPDGSSQIWARYTLQTDDGELLGLTNPGEVLPRPGQHPTIRTQPSFEVAARSRHRWLAEGLLVGTLYEHPSGNGVQLEFFRVH